MTAISLPSAEEQLSFLDHVQRLFEEGEFVATYKFALLLAITELAVERGTDSSDALELPLDAIADKFLELYWPQVMPYKGGVESGILVQSTGKQAAVVTLLQGIRNKFGTLPKARASKDWRSAVGRTVSLLQVMPLWRLQILRRQKVEFLYEAGPNASIRLLPGVMYNLRRFSGLLQQLVRAAWAGHIRENPKNTPIIGEASDLEQVLFGSDRSSLLAARPVLREIQSDTCFYCQGALRNTGEVDHFIPWARYPRDLGQNFVLAHKSCNGDKRDLLAAVPHLANWRDRNVKNSAVLKNELGDHFVCDETTMLRVAQWSYSQAYATGAQSWFAPKQVIPLTPEFRDILS
ncbi:HNH endonuclease [Noviherbaspirillum autotrophicum]|uniref:HNH endonuclease n=1 Tax=Noviherbaspirillum autotrophicum TaxID=709839 RepID=UPI000693A7AF|nr:HNH endonuclease domain-containing protein [Noviherbaspirillum autotrophicum]